MSVVKNGTDFMMPSRNFWRCGTDLINSLKSLITMASEITLYTDCRCYIKLLAIGFAGAKVLTFC